MYEVFPIAAGVIVALLARCIADRRVHGAVIAIGALVVGYSAATMSGEIMESKAFVLFDAGQFWLAGIVTTLLAARWRSAGSAGRVER